MSVRKNKGATAVGAGGATVVLVHVLMGTVGALTASQWLGGAVIGMMAVIAATLHVVIGRRRSNRQDSDPTPGPGRTTATQSEPHTSDSSEPEPRSLRS